eukprot:Phypoly_transcript_14702.p1 GENE.Phypoly_transcript_14702~~Phypoly_transcript_14702.p1  ORF type:complete len:320 (+),score=34.28 Phypoly_transcript_14702:38-961(+)
MNPARTFGPAVVSHSWSHHYIYWFGPFTASLLVGLLELFFSLFSQGQHAMFRASAVRKRREIREATSTKKVEEKKESVITAVPVILEPGTQPVRMIPIADPANPDRPFMVPVASTEQLRQLTDDLDEPQSIFRSPPSDPGPSYFSRKMSLLTAEIRRNRAHNDNSQSSEATRRGRRSSLPGFKPKMPLIPPAPLSDFSYLSDESLEDYPTDSASTSPLRPTPASTLNAPRQTVPASPEPSPKKSPPIRPSNLNQVVTMPPSPQPHNSPSRRSQGVASPKNSPGIRQIRPSQSPRTASPHLTSDFKGE